ncbi:MAG: proline dehydrogenase family protein [candidate division WOR-3 bacterium]
MNLINKLVILILRAIPKPILFLFAKRYIAGPDLSDALRVVRELNNNGILATVDLLGESLADERHVMEVVKTYKEILQALDREQLAADISIKPTHFGLLISKDFCYANVKEVVQAAAAVGRFVCMDMEDSQTVDATLEIYERLRNEGHDNLGWVSQAMLRRAVSDMKRMAKWKPVVRICKGIYKEPVSVAFQEPYVVQRNFGLVGKILASAGGYPAFATHNERMIWEALAIVHELGLKTDQYEFQMLYGVKEGLRDILVAEGHRMRLYVPFGKEWKPYVIRRFKENPDMLGYVIKALFTGKKG